MYIPIPTISTLLLVCSLLLPSIAIAGNNVNKAGTLQAPTKQNQQQPIQDKLALLDTLEQDLKTHELDLKKSMATHLSSLAEILGIDIDIDPHSLLDINFLTELVDRMNLDTQTTTATKTRAAKNARKGKKKGTSTQKKNGRRGSQGMKGVKNVNSKEIQGSKENVAENMRKLAKAIEIVEKMRGEHLAFHLWMLGVRERIWELSREFEGLVV